MKLKKIAKLFVLFSLMNLVGSVVWAEVPTKTITGENLAPTECKAESDQSKGTTATGTTDATKTNGTAAKGE